MVDLDIELIVSRSVGTRPEPVVITVVIRGADIHIRQGKRLHNLCGHGIDEVSRSCRNLERRAAEFGVSGALVEVHAVKRDECGSHRAPGVLIEDAGVWVPKLPFAEASA